MKTLEQALPVTRVSLSRDTVAEDRPHILLVDDEPHVLSALTRVLRRHFRVTSASGGREGLSYMQTETFAAIVSDMRMPEMDGATFLSRAKDLDPQAIRLMLTGEADLGAAASAVNQGEIFRFLRKPCTPDVVEAELNAAVERHRSQSAERVLLEQTLSGSVKVLTDVLALVCPVAFSRAVRVKRTATHLAGRIAGTERWQVELAAMLSQLGAITVSPETLERAYRGEVLDVREEQAMNEMSHVTDQLVANIPRLEPVREILRLVERRADWSEPLRHAPRSESVAAGAKIIRVALAYDVLESAGNSPAACVAVLRGRLGTYDEQVLDALQAVVQPKADEAMVREMPLIEVRVGMIFTRDVQSANGLVLIGRGQEVTPSVMQRIRNYWAHLPLKQPPLMQMQRTA